MKVRLTIDVGREERAGINRRVGRDGLATNSEVRAWATSLLEAHFPDLRVEGLNGDDWDADDAEASAAGNFV